MTCEDASSPHPTGLLTNRPTPNPNSRWNGPAVSGELICRAAAPYGGGADLAMLRTRHSVRERQAAEVGRRDSGAVVQARWRAWSRFSCAIQWLRPEFRPIPNSKEYFFLARSRPACSQKERAWQQIRRSMRATAGGSGKGCVSKTVRVLNPARRASIQEHGKYMWPCRRTVTTGRCASSKTRSG